jgi:hypothetical protein
LKSAQDRVSIAKKNLKKLQDAGVTIATGTDAGNIGTLHASAMHQELAIMRDAGLAPLQILINSTLHGAMLMGKEKDLGSIESGKFADLVVLNKDPFKNVDNYNSIDAVIKDGNLFKRNNLLPATPEELAQRQLVAYNAKDLEGFLSVYSDDVKLYNFPGDLILEGKDTMRDRYKTRFESDQLYAEIVNRSVMGDHVIDHERVTGIGDKIVDATVIYHISDGLIDKVWFIIK